jgi:hypothetical protein
MMGILIAILLVGVVGFIGHIFIPAYNDWRLANPEDFRAHVRDVVLFAVGCALMAALIVVLY